MARSSRKPHAGETGEAPQSRASRVRELLAWYDRHQRSLPWRARPGETPDPYRVWLSEIMLQQTTVAAVGPYYVSFLKRWPTVEALAAAPVEEVMSAWAGLGYYSRARNLHACAQAVAQSGGAFPSNEDALRALPGIGPYTAAAIAAIAFGRKAAPVDGNIERVLARLYAVTEPLPGAKKQLRALAESLAPQERAGDFAQAMMDLGATICTPKQPACVICPWTEDCIARTQGLAAALPYRDAKAERPLKRGAAFVAISREDSVLLRRRPPKGLLGGMHEPPMSPWDRDFPKDIENITPLKAPFRKLPGLVRHGFTHFELELQVFRADNVAPKSAQEGEWAPLNELTRFALPTVMKKVIAHALSAPLSSPALRGGSGRAQRGRRG